MPPKGCQCMKVYWKQNPDPHCGQKVRELEEEVERLREKGNVVCGLLRDTFYRPPGFSGPDPWWKDKSEAAISDFEREHP